MAEAVPAREPPPATGVASAPDRGNGEGGIATALRDRYELEHLRAETARLDEARRELVETLDLRTRRVAQLLGERDQLERQLIRAEAALQELSRKLGALEPRAEMAAAARAPALWPRLRGLLLGVLARFRPESARSRTAARAQAHSSGPLTQDRSGPLIAFADDGGGRPVIAVATFGLEPEQRASVLDIAVRLGRERGLMPLVLTDDDDFVPLRSRGMAFEYFPPPAARGTLAPALEWDLYLQRRLALIQRKWQPVQVIAFGGPAADVVRLWSDSPFEAPPPAALSKAPLPAASADGHRI